MLQPMRDMTSSPSFIIPRTALLPATDGKGGRRGGEHITTQQTTVRFGFLMFMHSSGSSTIPTSGKSSTVLPRQGAEPILPSAGESQGQLSQSDHFRVSSPALMVPESAFPRCPGEGWDQFYTAQTSTCLQVTAQNRCLPGI